MRKKSHISLANYLLDSIDSELLEQHRKAFIVGSVLPDCKPSFVTERHSIEETFDKVTEFVEKLTINHMDYRRISTAYCRKLGEVTHYVADYFTYPHNDVYEGSLKDHCVYEGELKHALVDFIDSQQFVINHNIAKSFKEPCDLCNYIRKMHQEYLNMEINIAVDCMYIVSLCQIVVEGILHLLAYYLKRAEQQVSTAVA
ncbi:MAG: zinc dependent phospholipase C family protein [Lachnospira sp.]|nr:zinc dependent phospholipase C family protein [Lachnospira sp.]